MNMKFNIWIYMIFVFIVLWWIFFKLKNYAAAKYIDTFCFAQLYYGCQSENTWFLESTLYALIIKCEHLQIHMLKLQYNQLERNSK